VNSKQSTWESEVSSNHYGNVLRDKECYTFLPSLFTSHLQIIRTIKSHYFLLLTRKSKMAALNGHKICIRCWKLSRKTYAHSRRNFVKNGRVHSIRHSPCWRTPHSLRRNHVAHMLARHSTCIYSEPHQFKGLKLYNSPG